MALIEQRRSEEEGNAYKEIRRGWFFGEETLKRELLKQMGEKVGEHHYAEERRESGEAKARRILVEELKRLRWKESDLARRSKGDEGKVRIARRLRTETTMTLKWIAKALHMGSWTYVSNLLARVTS